MSRERFNEIVEWTKINEGGLSTDNDDPGNWTGGKVGAGRLLGTKFGIAAKSYPDVDIPNLTWEEAKDIYYQDYYLKSHADRLPMDVDWLHFDCSVNTGISQSAKILQRAAGVKVDGVIGPVTMAAAAKVTPTRYAYQWKVFYFSLIAKRPELGKYKNGWMNRVDNAIKKIKP